MFVVFARSNHSLFLEERKTIMSSIEALSQRCTQTCDDIRNVPVLDFPVTQQVGRLAKELSSLSTSSTSTSPPLADIASLLQAEPWRQRGPSKVVITHLGAYPMLRPRRSL
ncbi:Hypothetical protein, putative [Bodo saltans]|uniref:Uncharacterized protein n=1 Tax=Bodo saltans TaxID=75058 RepID=A0A0S4JK13_BODSA|nr:Hypothetical protein, putative [Bodo saltans]|eukprot:CUG88825.1 Hypothetical protein, putative [Bodo saltans]